jgi:hypothetical protein
MRSALNIFVGLTGLACLGFGLLALTVVPAAPIGEPHGVAYASLFIFIVGGFFALMFAMIDD